MAVRVAFLRAVNVGKRTVAMSRAIETVTALGYTAVWSYVNSGNLIFQGVGPRSAIETSIERALESEFGFEVTTFVRTIAELKAALSVKPFTLESGDTYFITFLKDAPSSRIAEQVEAASNDFDRLIIHGRDVHWHMRGKSTDTTLKRATWKLLGEHSTSRNVTMLTKLAAKVDAR
jgi:uncharacterized protein (DUF1697 family)